MDEKEKRDPIPESFESIEAAAEFWDTHDLGDYWDQTREATFQVDLDRRIVLVPLEEQIARKLGDIARRQGISTETLVNVWLSERLQEVV
jgi:hypothetical protein